MTTITKIAFGCVVYWIGVRIPAWGPFTAFDYGWLAMVIYLACIRALKSQEQG